MGLFRILALLAALVLPVSAAAAVELPAEPPVTVPGSQTPAAATAGAQAAQPLTGLFRIEAGQCGDEGVEAGSWFRMVDPGGGHVENNDSPCGDNSWTPLTPGTDGGLVTGAYQPHPDPAFSSTGGGRADRITEPARFFGVDFSTATNEVDPQTDEEVPAPALSHDGDGGLTGDLRAFAAAWSGQHFNQGAPKPDGSRPEGTTGPTGTFDPATGAFTVEWTSRIQGGPFNGFTGVWHLTGTFEGSGGGDDAPSAQPAPGSPTTATFVPARPALAAAPSVAGGGSSGLASTGGTFPAAAVTVLAVAGMVGLAVSARVRRPTPPRSLS